MSILETQIAATLCPDMTVPLPLVLLFDWIEANGLFFERGGQRVGSLFPQVALRRGWTDEERPGGTLISFHAEGNVNIGSWLGSDDAQALSRICVFARTGADGSMAAFWLDEYRRQKIVHLGSGSGSVLTCVLAEDPVDFLRLLAIGYDEICWPELFSAPPNEGLRDGDVRVHPNLAYRHWVERTFSVAIPRTAREIVRHPAKMGDLTSPDPFCHWVAENSG